MGTLVKVSEQTGWQLLGKAVNTLSTILVLGLISRSLGETGVGIYTLALTYLTFFWLAADLNLNPYLLSQRFWTSSELTQLFNNRLWWSTLLVVVATLISWALPFGADFRLAVLIGSATIIASTLVTNSGLVFQQKLRYDLAALSSSIGGLIILGVVWYLISTQAPPPYLLIAPLLGWLANGLVGISLAQRFYQLHFSWPDFGYIGEIMVKVWPLSLTLVLNTLYFRLDAFILTWTYGLSTVGVYNLAYQIFQSALILPTFIMNSYYPLLLNRIQNLEFRVQNLAKPALVMAGLGALGTVMTLTLSPTIISLISGPGQFSGSVEALKILSLSFPAFFLSALLMWVLVALNRLKSVLVIYAVGLAVNLGLNLIFIPQYSYLAAAYITGISEYLILALQLFFLIRYTRK